MTLTITAMLVSQEFTPAAAQRVLARLQAMPLGKQQQVERMGRELGVKRARLGEYGAASLMG